MNTLKIYLFPEAVKFEGIFTKSDVFNQNIIDALSDNKKLKNNAINVLSGRGVVVSIENKKPGRERGLIPTNVILDIINKGILDTTMDSDAPFVVIKEVLNWMMKAVRANNKRQLAKHLNAEAAQPTFWEKSGHIPFKQILKAFEIKNLIEQGAEVIGRLTVSDKALSEAIGVAQTSIAIMKTEHPKKYKYLIGGMKLDVAGKIQDDSK